MKQERKNKNNLINQQETDIRKDEKEDCFFWKLDEVLNFELI